MGNKILVVDDDTQLTDLIEEFLEPHGFTVTSKHTPEKTFKYLEHETVDLVVLDIMLPGMDGLQLLRKLRETSSVPVIMLTARGEVSDRIIGLELGADDYMPKPFEPRELLARIQSILRRSNAPSELQDILIFDGLTVDKLRQEVYLDDELVHLSTTEFEALSLFSSNAGKVLDREFLVENIRGIRWQSYDRSIDVLVSRLRSKLGETPNSMRFIKTIHGVGYKFVALPQK
ncbi:MAG: response regulator [Fidelibacterota bacterium]